MGALALVFAFFSCSKDNSDTTQEVNLDLNTSTNIRSIENSEYFNQIIAEGEEFVYELSSDYVDEVSYNFEEEFNSIEKMDVVRYNDFHLFKITGQNLENAPSVQYYPIEEIEGSGEDVSLAGPRVRPCRCGGNTKIYYYQVRPDGSLYLSHTKCFSCPVGLLSALGW